LKPSSRFVFGDLVFFGEFSRSHYLSKEKKEQREEDMILLVAAATIAFLGGDLSVSGM